MPEQGRFEHVVRDRRTVDRNKWLIGAMRMLMDVARQHFLARARLTRDQHRGIAACDPRCQFEQLRARRLECYRPFTLSQAETAQGMTPHQIEQRLGLERFDQIVHRTLAHRIDRTLDCAVSRHQQHRQLRLPRSQQAQQLVAVHTRHVDVADHQAEGLAADGKQRLLCRTHRLVIVPREQ
ncbi:hypothetical protein D3C73_1005050 [compost metagenome]